MNIILSHKKISFIIFVFIIAFLMIMLYPTNNSMARVEGTKKVKSVFVYNGDSLWSIAKDNYTELNGSIREYMDEIKKTNHLESDAVESGTYLVVPYYIINN